THDALGVLEATARFDGEQHPVYHRVGAAGDSIVLDLADAEHRCVVITAEGWALRNRSPVRFRRPRGMLALPCPVRGGRIDELFNLINLDEADRPLVIAWQKQALRPRGPYPVLALTGEQGSAKSFTTRMLRYFIDPSELQLRAMPRDERDLVIAANN